MSSVQGQMNKWSLWVRIKGQANKGDTAVGVCCRPPDQEKEADEALCGQLDAASQSQTLVILEDFNHPGTVGGTTWLSTPSPGS